MIVGICGLAGSGKDTAADYLCRDQAFVKLAFADPLKRICRDVFEFTEEQLWGPSEKRNAPDSRYPREVQRAVSMFDPNAAAVSVKVTEFLTPRYALQRLGTEWGRDCYAPVWVEYALRLARKLDGMEGVSYDAQSGTFRCARPRIAGVAIPDCRFRNEVEAIRAAGGKVVRVVRPGAGLSGAAGLHPSEREMAELPDSLFDVVIENTGTLERFRQQVRGLATILNV